ncbi:manganese efflux pump MntP family protein [Halobacteriovorax sp. ZH4_bin.1]|uniref:manganese efflux pump MntP n=2 Tax=Halobacteriovorax TaxID=1652133 RepID=UPI0037181015
MINYFEVIIIGLVLCADSFSAAVAMGARPHKFSDTLKFAFSSGGAEALVAFLGAIAGAKVIAQFDYIDHWISFGLLTAVAIHMAYEGYEELSDKNDGEEERPKQFHSLLKVILVSFATSLDAFAVGVTIGASGKVLTPYITSIGVWAFCSTIVGMSIAKRASDKLGPVFSIIAAIILQSLAVKFLLEGL